ncbi:Carboxylesterase B [Streptomyces sp. RB5]|uniref:Carboxylesterase B n=1 Tax=Streptomyces smaragdinus TaxID=2585196 RepID=A0A7K0CPJ5_9ACTN|nr:alpha/beta hydrolase [Streptomyces smaragdinus]MQY15406.1 Carboxylesterase B [Streptomyces smaragdinus]
MRLLLPAPAAAALLTSALLLTSCTSSGAPEEPARARTEQGSSKVRTLAALAPEIPAALKPYYDQKLTWKPCADAPSFDCATLRVPLDYTAPDTAKDVKLAVSRTKATGGKRQGSLHVNPGGPGASAIEFLHSWAGIGYPPAVRAAYDMVAMDPRGVGGSQPVRCLTDREMEAHTQVDATPDDAGEISRLMEAFDKFAEGCEKHTGELLGHVSTAEVARDMDVLRAALGDEKLTYVGASYGTMLGATYAGLFPTRTGRLVLDGAMDPSLSALELNLEQNAGFDVAFDAFAADCVKRRDCPLGTESTADVGKRLRALLDSLDAKPLPTDDPKRRLSEPLATMGVLQAMYLEDFWPTLRDALAEALENGDGTGLLDLSDQYYERGPDGSYGTMMYAFAAVSCLDQPAPFRRPRDVQKSIPNFEAKSPVFGRDFAWAALNCGDWPVAATGTANRIEAKGAPPILVVGTTRDPATPYGWAKSLASQLDSGVLLTYEGDGHTAYVRGSTCVDGTINTFLLTGKAPKNGKRCT